jgi:hypothetical protein
MAVRVTEWRTLDGKRRVIRLYKAWRNLNDRVNGHNYAGNGTNLWVGAEVRWPSFDAFRQWALVNGYSKLQCSLDRRDSRKEYGPDNCRWLTVASNSSALAADQKVSRGIEAFHREPDALSWGEFETCMRLYA